MPESRPFISIVIPAYNAERTLEMCLTAALAQDYPQDRFEVILVDNASTDRTAAIAKATAGVRYVFERRQGPAAARNAGARAARGEVLAFTDSDCKPNPDWLARLAEGFAAGATACAGEIVPLELGHIIERFTYERGILVQARMVQGQGDFPFPISANFSIRAETFRYLGGFDEAYLLPGGEDLDMGWKLARQGIGMLYLPEAIVLHKHRTTWRGLTQQFFRYRVGICQFYKKHALDFPVGKPAEQARITRGELRHLARMAVWGLRRVRPSRRQEGTAYWRCELSIALGHLLGKLAWRWKYDKLSPADEPHRPTVLFLHSACCWREHNDPYVTLGQSLAKMGIRTSHWVGGGTRCSLFGTLEDWSAEKCAAKQGQVTAALQAAGLETHSLAEVLTDDVTAAARAWWEGLDKEPAALAATTYRGMSMWHTVKGSLGRALKRPVSWADLAEPEVLAAAGELFVSVAAMAEASDALFAAARPDAVLVFNGYFALERTVGEMARRRGVRVVAHENSSMKDLKLVCATGTVGNRHEFSSLAVLNQVEGAPLDERQRARVQARLDAICAGSVNSIRQGTSPEADLRGHLGIPPGRRLALLIGQVPFDTVMLYDSPHFPNLLEMIQDVIRVFADLPDYQLVVRLHPFEGDVGGDRTYHQLSAQELPPYVTLVHGRGVNTYDLMKLCDFGIAATSQAGLEMVALGKPVVVTGRPFYSGKGFTVDVPSRELLPDVIRRVAAKPELTAEQLERVYSFWHHYAFGFLVPFDAEQGCFPPESVLRIRRILFPT